MTGAITTFGIVVGMALLICYRLMKRMPKRRVVNGSSADHSGPAEGADVGDGGGHHFAWSAGENSASGHSAAANDSGGSDSGEAAIAAAVAINDPPWRPAFQAAQAVAGSILDSFQSVPGVSLESLEKTVFPFASRDALEYLMGFTSRTGSPV
jgi:hypothetical protein